MEFITLPLLGSFGYYLYKVYKNRKTLRKMVDFTKRSSKKNIHYWFPKYSKGQKIYFTSE